jgi:hypothetical protein
MLASLDVHMLCRLVIQKVSLLAVCSRLLNLSSDGLQQHQYMYASTSAIATISHLATISSLFASHQQIPTCPSHDHKRVQSTGPDLQLSYQISKTSFRNQTATHIDQFPGTTSTRISSRLHMKHGTNQTRRTQSMYLENQLR